MIYQVDLCPDAQSPEISTACPPDLDLIGPADRFNPPDILPFTGTAWFWLLLGVAIGAFIVGLLILWASRKRQREEEEIEAVAGSLAELSVDLAAAYPTTLEEARARLHPLLRQIWKGD